MATKAQALKVAARFGFVLDEVNSGPTPGTRGQGYTVIFDHPTHSLSGECRSITSAFYTGGAPMAYAEAIARMESEGADLVPCTDPECDYHHEGEEV